MKKTNNVVVLKSNNAVSNSLVNRFAESLIASFKADDKTRKKAADNWFKDTITNASGDAANSDIARAHNTLVNAQDEYNRHASKFINSSFGADKIVTELINKIGEKEVFFTPEYLDKLGIYKIPSGTILDTTQKCVSFVSSLYATASSEHRKQIKDGTGIEVVLARCKERIAFNDSVLIYTKFSLLDTDSQLKFVGDLLDECTISEKNNIYKRLGIDFRINTTDNSVKKLGIIPIEGYAPKPLPIDVNFYHKYAVSAKALTKADAKKVMEKPVTPIK